MTPHDRALIAAAAHALVTGTKAAGLYDHAAGRHLRIAAEGRGGHLQGYDGERDLRFGGSLPELRDASGALSVHMTVDGTGATGFHRGAAVHFTARVEHGRVQLYDHGAAAWFAYDVGSA